MNDNTLIAILTTSDSHNCLRAWNSVPDHYSKVCVVNTPVPDYLTDVSKKLPGATIIETTCTGTPGQGKQSVWDYFLTTDYDYLIMMEGDDVFLPGAVDTIVSWQTQLPANAWAVCGEDIIADQRVFSSWRTMDLDLVLGECDIDELQHQAMKSYMQQVFGLISHRGYDHQRIVQIDRHTAQNYRYNINLIGSEDVHMNSQLKLSHLKNQLDFRICLTQEISCYLKNTHTGAGRRFMRSDTHTLESEFYRIFSDSDLRLLRNTELLNTDIPRVQSDFVRRRWYLKMLRGRT